MSNRLHFPAVRLAILLVIVVVLCAGFGWWQNQAERLGGPISLAKCLWLATALGCFFVIPWALWHDRSLGAPLRRLAGWFFAGFLVRAAVEVPVLLLSGAWRCWHGLLHDAVMLGWLLVAGLRLPGHASATEAAARRVLPLLGAALIFEMLNAWLFQEVGRPQDGEYFAAPTERFHLINRLTWIEVVLLWPLLAFWIVRYAWSTNLKAPPAEPGTWI